MALDTSTIVEIENVQISLPLQQFALSTTWLGLVEVSVMIDRLGHNLSGPYFPRLKPMAQGMTFWLSTASLTTTKKIAMFVNYTWSEQKTIPDD